MVIAKETLVRDQKNSQRKHATTLSSRAVAEAPPIASNLRLLLQQCCGPEVPLDEISNMAADCISAMTYSLL